MPKGLPPRSTLFEYFDLWDYDGTLDRIHHALYVKCREAMGREASPTAGVIDSQSVKGAETDASCMAAGLPDHRHLKAKHGPLRQTRSMDDGPGPTLHGSRLSMRSSGGSLHPPRNDWVTLGDGHRLDQLASASSRHIIVGVIWTITLPD